ncbi:tachykinins isoform X2 [Frieseomelitta varia]|uniref:tachykinins isoform X2 n=1 Tax=Frieseomelitta varia TaxID=561572 RepID=UPI001CB68841|nr:tachykinins isoform X2 [Frieseomelitta varia]
MIIRSTFLLMVSFTFAIAEESSDALSDKRGAMGFQGMRGKKSFDTLDPDDFGVLKRAIMGFQGMRGKKNSIITDVADELFSEETNKRAPMGFQGMRGKKALLDDEYYKRAPMGFQGMRGKKSLEEDPRGQDVYLIDYPEDYEKRVLSMDGFSNVFDKKDEFPWEKRAPMGFQGTRGKKSILDTWENLDKPSLIDLHDFERRKDTIDDYLDYSINPSDYDTRAADFQDIENSGSPFKRARMGFHGMRGKRNAGEIYGFNSSTAGTTIGYQGVPNLAVYEIEKRSPFRYLGVRGKKNPRWEFRGKFVGVRGKKASTLQAVF